MRVLKPSPVVLAGDAMYEMSDEKLSELLFECMGGRKEVINYILENFDDTVMELAEDEWDARCEYLDRLHDSHLSPSGGYSL